MKKIFRKYAAHAFVILAVAGVLSCTKVDEYKEFLKGKETVYTGKADSVEVHAGKYRLSLTWLVSDPKITRGLVYWNNKSDSVEVNITRSGGIDTVSVVIPNLEIGVYNFVIYLFDADNNKSVPVYATGRVYGDNYEKNLVNRRVLSAYRWTGATPLFIVWETVDTKITTNVPAGVEINYQDNGGITHTDSLLFDPKRDTCMFTLPANVSPSAVIKYRTLVKPDASALDVFRATEETLSYSFVPLNIIDAKEEASGVINISPTNSIIDKNALTFTKVVNITRVSLDKSIAYTTDVQLTTTGIPSGTTAVDLGVVSMTNGDGASASVLSVPAGQQTAKLNFKLPKSTLDANAGKKLAFVIKFSNLANAKFNLSGAVYSVAVVVDVDAFMVVNDVTTTYFKNAGGSPNYFIRSDASPTSRWGIAQDWIATSNVLNVYGNTKGGIDNWPGYNCLNMVRWGTPQIYDGKLYQTFTLPKGKYEFQVDFETIGVHPEWNAINTLYLVVADGAGLPNTSGVATSIAYSSYSTPKVGFTLSQSKTVSIGFLAYLENDSQEFRARQVKLLQYIGAFD